MCVLRYAYMRANEFSALEILYFWRFLFKKYVNYIIFSLVLSNG